MPGAWVAGPSSKFDGMTLAQAARLLGAKRSAERRAALPESTIRVDAAAIPASFNASANWPQCSSVIGHIRDQSDCGCCWAFGSTEAFNDRLCIAYNTTKIMSPQDTCSCANPSAGYNSNGCDGGFTEASADRVLPRDDSVI